ncbi:QseC-like sensor histidine kinase [Enterobacter roggenkampii]|uniref:QseC-like sensor histidine kinase n=1 Tax=Enterobacter roggenkampii TaxID=1812935 RepID=UPI003D6F6329
MAGFQKRVKNSLKLQLSVALSVAILFTAVISCGLTFYFALDEAHELQDGTLTQIASVIYDNPDSQTLVKQLDGDNDSRVVVEFISENGNSLQARDPTFQLETPMHEGFQNVISGGESYRVLVHRLSPTQLVAIGQQLDVRDEISFESALRTLIPLSLLLPILLLVATDLIRKAFRPVSLLADEVHQRDERNLTPFPEDAIPDEIRPFVGGINKLLHKVNDAMQTQSRFIADAAHELRTPLTALSLQAERLSASEMSPEAQFRLNSLQQGLSRTKNLLEQLLLLAREQQNTRQGNNQPLLITQLFREVIESLHPLALEKSIDIGVLETASASQLVYTDKYTLTIIVKNLVENAIRYIPEHGQIDLSVMVSQHEAIIKVEDNGPGIAAEERMRVFDAFYRPEGVTQPGSGLGLAIVKACVTRLGGKVTLAPASQFTSGVLVSIVLPLQSEVVNKNWPPR